MDSNQVVIEILRDYPIMGGVILPGSTVRCRLNKATPLVNRGIAKEVTPRAKKNVDRVDTDSDAGTGKPAGKRSSGKAKAEAGSE